MKPFWAFFRKEWLELIRSGKLLIIVTLFTLFGVMNPAMAKLTPWMMELASESLAGAGIVVTEVTVDAMTSWTQYYKNISLAIIIFLLMISGILTVEFHKKTLINMVTMGLERWKVVLAKSTVAILLWSFTYWLCFGITYVYNAYFWDNGIAEHLFFSAFCVYILGAWLVSLIMFMSVVSTSNTGVLLLTSGIFGVCYLAGMLSKVKKYLPIQLMSAENLLSDIGSMGDYYVSMVLCVTAAIGNIIAAIILFNRRNFNENMV